MKVTFKKDKTIIELKTTDEREATRNALQGYVDIKENYKDYLHCIIDKLLKKWEKEAESYYLGL